MVKMILLDDWVSAPVNLGKAEALPHDEDVLSSVQFGKDCDTIWRESELP